MQNKTSGTTEGSDIPIAKHIGGRHFKLHLENYTEWLHRLGYAESTIYSHRMQLANFFNWLAQKNITGLRHIIPTHLSSYHHDLETRPNRVRSGGLSGSMIYNYLHVLKIFNGYLQQHGLGSLPIDHLQLPLSEREAKEVLSVEDIRQLYAVTDEGSFGYRDRAMLALCYGCGLRRNEAVSLHCDDIDWQRKYLHIRKGKGAKARYVPFNDKTSDDLKAYYPYYRSQLLVHATPLFLLGQRGRIRGDSLNNRLKALAQRAGLTKKVHLHLLRHSIATHLLQEGMDIEHIASFLGHDSLEATQIYTHYTE